MKKLLVIVSVLVIMGSLASCEMFSAMDTMVGAIEATGEYIYDEVSE